MINRHTTYNSAQSRQAERTSSFGSAACLNSAGHFFVAAAHFVF
jgi:hypothetical protein